MKVEIKTVKLSAIKLNPDNPRTISKKDMDLLVKSLSEFPDMLKLREINLLPLNKSWLCRSINRRNKG